MKLLHLTDTHLGHSLRVHTGPSDYSRSDDMLNAMSAALAPAMNQSVDLVVHSGDLFDQSAPDQQVVDSAIRLIKEVCRRVPMVIICGNHEKKGLNAILNQPIDGLSLIDAPTTLSVKGLQLGCVPFVRDADLWRHHARQVADGCDALIAHQAFDGARVPGFTFRAGRQVDTVSRRHLPPSIKWILCGHIHTRQITRLGGAQIVQPGSTERTAFAEHREEKGYALWDFSSEPSVEFVDLKTRAMRWIKSADDLDSVQPTDLVMLPKTAERWMVEAARRRGGWIAGRRPRGLRSRQASLFDRGLA